MGSLQPTLTMGSLFRESAAQRWVRESEELPTKYRWPREREVVGLSLGSCKDTNDISDMTTVSTDFVDMTTVSADITEITTVSNDIRKILSETVLRPRKTSTSTMQRLVTVTLVILLFSNINH